MGAMSYQRTAVYTTRKKPAKKKKAKAAPGAPAAAPAPPSVRKARTAGINRSRVDHFVHSAMSLPPAELELVRTELRAAEKAAGRTS